MPSLRPKPSEVAVEAKRTYLPFIEQTYPDLPARSFAYSKVDRISTSSRSGKPGRPRVAVMNGDAVDVALQWNQEEENARSLDTGSYSASEKLRIPLVLPVDEKRAGGDWESGSMGPEENLSRRSNLVNCLSKGRMTNNEVLEYPIPSEGGMYSPQVGNYNP
jgi:hypothetical protein